MLITRLHQHFNNNEVYHAFRREDLTHDVYKNRRNNLQITIPIDEDEIPDEFIILICQLLEIETPYELPPPSIASTSVDRFNS
jgi:hypothetical protein